MLLKVQGLLTHSVLWHVPDTLPASLFGILGRGGGTGLFFLPQSLVFAFLSASAQQDPLQTVLSGRIHVAFIYFFLLPFVEATFSHYFSNNDAKVKAINIPSGHGKGKIAPDSSDKMWPFPPVRRPLPPVRVWSLLCTSWVSSARQWAPQRWSMGVFILEFQMPANACHVQIYRVGGSEGMLLLLFFMVSVGKLVLLSSLKFCNL